MLRNNLSSRPFYNERGVSLLFAFVGLAVIALLVFNVTQLWALSSERAQLMARIDQDRAATSQVRADTAAVERGLEAPTLSGLLISTREANSLIDERTFSWTVFFDYIERTLPMDVRLVAVAPRIDKGIFLVQMLVVTRQPEDLETFYDALRDTGAFSEVYSTAGQTNEDGTLRADVQAKYSPPRLAGPEKPGAAASPAGAAPGRGRGGRP